MTARRSRWLVARWLLAALVAAAAAPGVARADDDLDAQLARYETEVRQIGANLPRPNQLPGAIGQRRLLDAELAYAMGDYDGAALMLFDLASNPGPDRETATFYLAEALFQKQDRGAAAGYYEQVIAGGSTASKYYQPSLVRLVEIAIAQHDDAGLTDHLVLLDRVSPGLRLPSVPYVRGKAAYAQGKYDDAIAYFQDVPKGSDYELQAAYYLGTTQVARHDIDRAIVVFGDVIGRRPRTANDRRMIELSQLALGRLYYERDQASKSIDSYLLVDRHSDLFPDALYEVAWVYVKSRQYDKALRALELLAKSDPQSTKTPTVRILEGNLRVRKAQMIRAAQIQGTIDAKEQDDPSTEYDRAVQVFTDTHDQFTPSYAALVQMVGGRTPPEHYLDQIAGRSARVFQTAAPIPEAAVQYLRDEPEVQRVVAVEGDLGEIQTDLAQTEATIARLEGVLAAGDRTAVYPELAHRRGRIAGLEAEVIKIRSDLAERELRLVQSSGELTGLSANRRQRVAGFAAMPDPERTAEAHRLENQAGFDALDQSAQDADGAIGQAEAMAVAMRKYTVDQPDLPAEQTKHALSELDDAGREAEAIERELAGLHRELQIGRDLAGTGDPSMAAAASVRAQVRFAEDAEHKLLASLADRSSDRDESRRLSRLAERAAGLAAQLSATERVIDGVVDQGLQQVRGLLAEARAQLAAYRAELAEHEAESRSIGGAALAASFQVVKAKFYDIVIRSDVGNVDVAWSQKEDIDDDLKRLNLSRQRELKQLKDEFKDILDAGTPKPSAPARPAETAPAAGTPDQPGDQPGDLAAGATADQSGGPDRAARQAAPAVRPDAAKPAAKSAAKPATRSAKPAAAKTAPKDVARTAPKGSGGAP